ncbi:hypothetical protein A0J61_07227 [Choanephora cucurbitarum]|uniref:Uncharacterized protein n=1 Tax=Choanephora cucurbitarum TaxID=101091 RepID=A0A1C7NBK4_9FUNG|nr:hypothetical protein A0J61_07227 [Choanephora cucurbitarum]
MDSVAQLPNKPYLRFFVTTFGFLNNLLILYLYGFNSVNQYEMTYLVNCNKCILIILYCACQNTPEHFTKKLKVDRIYLEQDWLSDLNHINSDHSFTGNPLIDEQL